MSYKLVKDPYRMTRQKTMTALESAETMPTPVEPPPFLLEFFMVQGVGFRCAAYCDEDGRWREAHTHEELQGPIEILG